MTISFDVFSGVIGSEAGEMLSAMQKRSFQDGLEQVWSAEDISSLLKSPGIEAMVVSENGHPIGFILSRQVAEEAEILTICVLPAHRNRGMASQLLQEFHGRSARRGVKEIFLEVRENNRGALILYQKNGFETVGRRKGYYGGKGGKKQDALVMKFSIK